MVIDELLLGGLIDAGGCLDLVVLVGGGAGLLEQLLICCSLVEKLGLWRSARVVMTLLLS